MRSGFLRGRDHLELGAVGAIAEGSAAIAISRGGARKTYSYVDPNEDGAVFAIGEGGILVAVADGHDGAWGSERALEHLLVDCAPTWTAAAAPFGSPDAWREIALDALLSANVAILADAAERKLPTGPTTLSLALLRPGDDLLLHACMGDSHVFRAVSGGGAVHIEDLGWGHRDKRQTFFLGYGQENRERLEGKSRVGCIRLAQTRAVVLVTDGLSEKGIGVTDPAAAVEAEVVGVGTGETDPELRPLELCKAVVGVALDAQRANQAGDNAACAVVWVED
ncbi:MAG: protein phosphatase 2C domain-containing protein [Proteobacteria bacterium]|nr:protein phosphatase 2C domain-containing protein [Pseudomonadota bacterium]